MPHWCHRTKPYRDNSKKLRRTNVKMQHHKILLNQCHLLHRQCAHPWEKYWEKNSHLFMHDTDLLCKAGQHCSWTVFALLTAVSFSATCLISQEPWLWLLLRIKSARKAWGECGAVGIQIKTRKLCIPTKGFLVHVSCKLQHPSRQTGIFNGSFNSMYNLLVSYTLPHLCQPTEH